MKKFICSFFKILFNTIIFLLLAILVLLFFTILFSKTNDIDLEDTISSIGLYAQEVTGFNVTSKDSVAFFNNSNTTVNENNVINIVNTNNLYYYNQLDENSKIIYNSLENNIDNLKKQNFTIKFSTKFNTLLNQSNGRYLLNKAFQNAVDAFFYDHPELFYIDLTKISLVTKSTTIGSKTTYTVSLVPKDGNNYLVDSFNSEDKVVQAIKEVEYIRNNIIATMPNGSDYEKALQVHDSLVTLLEYESSSDNTYNIYGALVEKKVVCEGYAKAFKYILDSLDIDCILVSGDATNSSGKTEAHMWNYIKLDNKWYGVDVTWDDPIIIGGNISKKIIRHTYFCKGSNVFNESHTISNYISDDGKLFKIPTLSVKNYK